VTTTRDVARRAGVSVGTVSAVLNRNKFVSDELGLRVQQAIEELGYRPNLVARSLKSGRTRAIGIIIPNIRDPYWAEIVAGIEGVARSEGYSILLFDTEEDPEQEERSLQIVSQMKADGVVLVPTGDPEESGRRVASLLLDGVSAVLLSRQLPGVDLDAILGDNEQASYLATRHLLHLGYQRVAILVYPASTSSGEAKLRGYQRAHTEAGCTIDPQLIRFGGRPLEGSGRREMECFLTLPGGKPDAILACTHLLVMGILQCVKDHGLRIPEDLGLVGFDDYPWSPHMQPPLTVVRQPRDQMGVMAARRLLQRIRGEILGPGEQLRMPTDLIVRESCGCLLRRPTRGEVAPRVVTGPLSAGRCIDGEEERCKR